MHTVINVNHKSYEQILMKMLYATCISHLVYASDVIQYSVNRIHSMTVALNDCILRAFTYNRWESERYLRISFGYPSLTEIFKKIYKASSTAPVTSKSYAETLTRANTVVILILDYHF